MPAQFWRSVWSCVLIGMSLPRYTRSLRGTTIAISSLRVPPLLRRNKEFLQQWTHSRRFVRRRVTCGSAPYLIASAWDAWSCRSNKHRFKSTHGMHS